MQTVNIKMTMREFEKHCSMIRPEQVIFYTSNQDWKNNSFSTSLVFDRMNIGYNPNRILLTAGEPNCLGRYYNTMKFSRIKYILFTQRGGGLDGFTLVCGDSKDDTNDIRYKICIQGLKTWDKFIRGKF